MVNFMVRLSGIFAMDPTIWMTSFVIYQIQMKEKMKLLKQLKPWILEKVRLGLWVESMKIIFEQAPYYIEDTYNVKFVEQMDNRYSFKGILLFYRLKQKNIWSFIHYENEVKQFIFNSWKNFYKISCIKIIRVL